MIETIAFDADDTLWQNETLFQDAQSQLARTLSQWTSPDQVKQAVMDTEMRNLPIYGYGIKAFTLSMIETALAVSEGKIGSKEIEEILALGRAMLQAEVALLPGVKETLQALSADFRLMVITKGDLLDQTNKFSRSGLTSYFSFVEVVHQKTPETYHKILVKHSLDRSTFIMVGNSLRSDIAPVLALGAKAVHIPTHTTWELERLDEFDPAQEGFYEVASFLELPALIEKINTHTIQ